MKTLLLTLGLGVLLTACANPDGKPRTFDNNDLELATGNSARMGCSCRFVMEMPEDFCRAWVRASPDIAMLSFDMANKAVESSAFMSVSARAHYVDEKRGCVLE